MDRIRLISCALIASLGLVGCGETTGLTNTDPTPTTEPNVSPTPTTSITPTQIALATSEPATAARSIVYLSGIAAENIAGDNPVSGATINIEVQDQSLDGKARTQTYTATTNTEGLYEVQLQDVGLSGNYDTFIDVTARKEGWTDGIKRLTNFSLTDTQTVSADVVMTAELVSIQSVNSEDLALASGASQASELRFTVFSTTEGEQFIVAGQDAAQAAAASGANPQLDVRLPVSSIDSSVSTVVAGIQGFTPADPDQVQSFPGEFVGNGDPSSVDNGVSFSENSNLDDNYRLISTGFAQVRLQDQDGNELPLAEGATTSNSEAPKIYLALDPATYRTITEDRNSDVNGIQVPIFIYRNGWEFAGNGTLMLDSGSGVYSLYNGAVANIATEDDQLFVELAITDGNKWIRWVNLDWPVQAAGTVTTVDVCFQGNITYAPVAGRAAEPFEGYVNITTPDGGRLNSYVAGGAFDSGIQTMTSDRFDTSPESWTFSAINRLTGGFESLSLANLTSVQNGQACNDLGTITLSNPNQCIVEGTVTKEVSEGSFQGQGGQLLAISAERFSRRVITTATGYYQAAIPCDVAVQVAPVGGEAQTLAAADNKGVSEVNLSFANIKPVIAGVSAPRELTLIDGAATATLAYSAYDLDSDDITIELTCNPVASEAAALPQFVIESGEKSCTVNSPGDYQWTLTVSDAVSSVNRTGRFTVFEAEQNRPPQIRLIMAGNQALSCERDANKVLQCNQKIVAGSSAVTYTAIATDVNGDELSFAWNNNSATTNNTHSQTFTTDTSITLAVSDQDATQALTDSASINVEVVPNQAPELRQLFNASGDIALTEVEGQYQNSDVVTFTAIVFDFEASGSVTLTATLQTAGNDSPTTVSDIEQSNRSGQRTSFSIPLPANSLVTGSNVLIVTINDGTADNQATRTIPIRAVGSNDGTTVVFD